MEKSDAEKWMQDHINKCNSSTGDCLISAWEAGYKASQPEIGWLTEKLRLRDSEAETLKALIKGQDKFISQLKGRLYGTGI